MIKKLSYDDAKSILVFEDWNCLALNEKKIDRRCKIPDNVRRNMIRYANENII